MNMKFEPPEIEVIQWPDTLRPDEDDEKEFCGLLEEE